MGQRESLDSLLREQIPSNGEVYFQPQNNTQIVYTCILYSLDFVKTDHADNAPYNLTDRYMVTVIDRNPDTDIWRKVARLPSASFVRAFWEDNLNHYIFNLSY